ncbi:MAG: pilus assembly protein [Proteobacteria bacterium]|nr:pilus assembly protein [Pseudomonadota bacterium]
MKAFLHKAFRDQTGATALEFAFCAPLFLMFVFALFSFSQMYWIWNTMDYAVNEAGRYVMAHTSASASDIQDKIKSNLMGIKDTDITVNISDTSINGAPFKQIQASYSYNYRVLKGFFGLEPSTLVAKTLVPES